jgi:hypothetical protein
MTARAETAALRLATLRRLDVRNRLVSALRLGVPALGLSVFLVFAGQVLLASLGSNFRIGEVSFSGNTVTVDTPSYSGVMDNGDVYTLAAEAAHTTASDLNLIALDRPRLELTKPSGVRMTATAAAGTFDTLTQVMTLPGLARVSDSDGNRGTLEAVTVDLHDQTLTASGRALITMGDGMTIDAAGLAYDARTSEWRFGHARVVLPSTPGSDDTSGDRR